MINPAATEVLMCFRCRGVGALVESFPIYLGYLILSPLVRFADTFNLRLVIRVGKVCAAV
eukprot:scaffold8633_cov106-Cylindrotheca_fusiformis.AAC.4